LVHWVGSEPYSQILDNPEILPETNALAYLSTATMTRKKRFQNDEPRDQCYKTFYGRNIRIFIISFTRVGSGLARKHYTILESLARDRRSSL
jgi:hypothetical protein